MLSGYNKYSPRLITIYKRTYSYVIIKVRAYILAKAISVFILPRPCLQTVLKIFVFKMFLGSMGRFLNVLYTYSMRVQMTYGLNNYEGGERNNCWIKLIQNFTFWSWFSWTNDQHCEEIILLSQGTSYWPIIVSMTISGSSQCVF